MGNTPFWLDKTNGRFYYDKQKLPTNTSDLEYWDSVLEYRTYQKLLEFLHPSQISRQVNIEILPRKSPFLQWNWNIDFTVSCNSILIPIEVKGKWLLADAPRRKCFCQTLQVFQNQNENLFNRLLIVSDTDWQIPSTSLMIFSLNKLQQKIAMLLGG